MNAKRASSIDASRLPEACSPPRLIVCESTGCWAVALRRELTEERALAQVRSVAECWESLAEAPASFAVVELTRANFAGLLEKMAWWESDFPLARLTVVTDRSFAGYQWVLREAGAVHFTTSPRRLRPLAELACRHLDAAPLPRRTTIEQIWADLPWATESRQ